MNNKLRITKIGGFTLVEMMIVVAIVALLAAIAIPGYLQHIKRARASEAVATMTLIRQSLRDYYINNSAYFDVATGDIDEQPTTGVAIDVGIAQFFSNNAYSVVATSPAFDSDNPASPGAVDFVIIADGNNSQACGSSDCALHASTVANYVLEMDNTGRVFLSFDDGASWTSYQ